MKTVEENLGNVFHKRGSDVMNWQNILLCYF